MLQAAYELQAHNSWNLPIALQANDSKQLVKTSLEAAAGAAEAAAEAAAAAAVVNMPPGSLQESEESGSSSSSNALHLANARMLEELLVRNYRPFKRPEQAVQVCLCVRSGYIGAMCWTF